MQMAVYSHISAMLFPITYARLYNNESERRLRFAVVGRKNYYGSGSIWSGQLSAALFTILQTLLVNNVNPKPWLRAYFQACAENGGRAPENVDDFLAWNLSETVLSKTGILDGPVQATLESPAIAAQAAKPTIRIC